MAVDSSNDIFEGVVLYTLSCIMSNLVATRAIDGGILKEMFNQFPYHRVDVNKPQPPTVRGTKVTFKETHSEAAILLRLLPLMMMNVMEDFDTVMDAHAHHWNVLLRLIQLVQLIMADSFTESMVTVLEKKIGDWLSEFHSKFPGFIMTPKFHYLVHYPSQVRRHGPPRK